MLSVGIILFLFLIFIIAIVLYPRDTETSNLENQLLEEKQELDVVTQIRELNLFPSNAYCPAGTVTPGTCSGGFLLTYHSLINSNIFIKNSSQTSFTNLQEFKFDSAEDFIKGMQSEMGDTYIVTIHNLTNVQIRITAFDFPTFQIAAGAVASLRLAVTGVGPGNFTEVYKISVSKFF